MKKTLLIAFVASLAMASCKKDRTCACTYTTVSSTVNGVSQTITPGTHTDETKLTKVSKKGAACNDGERTETSTYTNNNVAYTQVDVEKADCELK